MIWNFLKGPLRCSGRIGRRKHFESLSSLHRLWCSPTPISVLLTRCSSGLPVEPGRRRNLEKFRISVRMSDEQRTLKLAEIERMRNEEKPVGLFAKCKFYFKRYWYIAIPVHCVCSVLWFGSLYMAVKSGIDVISLLHMLHLPEPLIEKVKEIPESAGILVVAAVLYKIATPVRYATTLAGIQLAFWVLRRMGKLKTVREVEYGVRSGLERRYDVAIRRLNERRNRSVGSSANITKSSRDIQKANTTSINKNGGGANGTGGGGSGRTKE